MNTIFSGLTPEWVQAAIAFALAMLSFISGVLLASFRLGKVASTLEGLSKSIDNLVGEMQSQWSKLGEHETRISKVEGACEARHGKE
jgi:hypothetical protein